MKSVKAWVEQEANQVIFVYGEFDPWTAGEFPVSISGKDVFKFFVPAGNHSANFSKLGTDDNRAAMELISRWLGKSPVPLNKIKGSNVESLEDIEFRARKSMRL